MGRSIHIDEDETGHFNIAVDGVHFDGEASLPDAVDTVADEFGSPQPMTSYDAVREAVARLDELERKVRDLADWWRKCDGDWTGSAAHCLDCLLDPNPRDQSLTPPNPGPTVRVRIAVAVNADGAWTAGGGDISDDRKSAERVSDGWGPNVVHFVEADLPVPETVTVEGEVTE